MLFASYKRSFRSKQEVGELENGMVCSLAQAFSVIMKLVTCFTVCSSLETDGIMDPQVCKPLFAFENGQRGVLG